MRFGAEEDMRQIPPIERSPQEIAARQTFEQYMSNMQASRISVAIGAIGGAAAGGRAAGIPGAVVGGILGALTSYWRRKAYRMEVYAILEAQGMLVKRTIGRRDLWSLQTSNFAFVRLPYAELTALVIVPILQTHYPDMTDEELREIGRRTQRTLIAFRNQFADVPIELAAEVILAYYGIVREPGQAAYDLAWDPTPGEEYFPPATVPAVTPQPTDLPTELPAIPPVTPDAKKKPSILLYVVIIGLVLLMLSQD